MSHLKKGKEKIKFSKLRLRSTDNKPKKSFSPRPEEKISSYFSSTINNNETTINEAKEAEPSSEKLDLNSGSDSSQNLLTNLKSTSEDDDNDFAVPKNVKPAKKFDFKTFKSANPQKKQTRTKKQTSTFGVDTNLKSCSDTNLEHLQLALAMSKSIDDLDPNKQKETENDSPCSSTQEKITRIRKTLDQFGFKSRKTESELSGHISKRSNQTRKKFKYITPILYLRKDEDRLKMIENKVSQIISNISIYNQNNSETLTENFSKENIECIDNKPRSFALREYYNKTTELYQKNCLDISEMNDDIFYNGTISPNNVKIGTLLRDWGSIPGREKTPPLNEEVSKHSNSKVVEQPEPVVETTTVNNQLRKSDEILYNRSISPDLFASSDSDSETNSINKTTNSNNSIISETNKNASTSISSKTKNISVTSEFNSDLNSDHSDTNSPSILDNISPRRNKNKYSPVRKIGGDSCKKNIFESHSVSLLDQISPNKNKTNSILNKNKQFSPKARKDIFSEDTIFLSEHDTIINSPKVVEQNSQIRHFESFCDDSNNCLDLTLSSDDSAEIHKTPKENADRNVNDDDDEFMTVTQILKVCSPTEKNIEKDKEDVVDLTQSSKESKEVVDNEIMDQVYEKDHLSDVELFSDKSEAEFSPEFDCFDSSNNREFYNSLNKTSISPSGSENSNQPLDENCVQINPSHDNFIMPRTSPSEFCYNKLYDEDDVNIVTFLGHVNRNELSSKKSLTSFNKTIDTSATSTSTSHDLETLKKSANKMLRRSFSENIIGDTEYHLTSPKSRRSNEISKLISPHKSFHDNINLSQSFDDIEISDEELNYSVCKSSSKNNKSKSKIHENDNFKNNDGIERLSQSSIDSDISDEELNYSSNTPYRRNKLNQYVDDIINRYKPENLNHSENMKELSDNDRSPHATKTITRVKTPSQEMLKHPRVKNLSTPTTLSNKSFSQPATTLEDSFNENLKQIEILHNVNTVTKTPDSIKTNQCVITPSSEIVVKTTNVTPMAHYSDMDTPERNKELDKFGLKPMKRAKGVKILRYIYESTHPIRQKDAEKIRKSSSDDEDNRVIKRRRSNNDVNEVRQSKAIIKSRKSQDEYITKQKIECLGNEIAESESLEDMIFERKQSMRIMSCRLPLHIAWHNLVSSQKELQENILLYEPIQVEEIYAKLKSFGYKFHIQDIISFLDKKCITIRIAQNNRKRKAGVSPKK